MISTAQLLGLLIAKRVLELSYNYNTEGDIYRISDWQVKANLRPTFRVLSWRLLMTQVFSPFSSSIRKKKKDKRM